MREILTRVLTIRAPARIVYELLTDAKHFAEWMAVETELEPWPGGLACWQHAHGDVCRGWFVELVLHRRVVFTYGWERADGGSIFFDTRRKRSPWIAQRPPVDGKIEKRTFATRDEADAWRQK